MTQDVASRIDPRAKIAGAFGIGFGFFAGAGVTGLSMLIGILGIWALVSGLTGPNKPLLRALAHGVRSNWLAWLLFAAFIIWVMISATWSPAEKLAGESVRRIGAMAILAPLAVWAASTVKIRDYLMPHRAILAGLAIALFILLFETITGGSINKLASPEKEPLALDGDLGRAASATLALFWIGFALIRRHYSNQYFVLGYVGICLLLATQFGTDLNAVGLVFGTCAAGLALWFPRVAIGTLTAISSAVIVAAPALYPIITKMAVAAWPGGQLPLSYGRRAQMWQVAVDMVGEKPLTGWGVGAGSTVDRIISFGGFDWPLIQLHPHAAPLHIWLETGAVGAVLASLAIIAAGRAAILAFGRHKIAAAAFVGGMTFLALQWGLSHAAWREWMWTSFAAVLAFSMILREPPEVRASDEDNGL